MSLFSSVLSVYSCKTFKIVDYEDELDLLSVVAVTQIDAEGKAHLDFHCNEYGTLLKSIPLVESWDVVSRVHGVQSGKSSLYRWCLLKQMYCLCQSQLTWDSGHLHSGQNKYFVRLPPLGTRGCCLTSVFFLGHAIYFLTIVFGFLSF